MEADRLVGRAEDLKGEVVEIRRDLHQHPELGFEEHRTSRLVEDYLVECGIDTRSGIADTGVVGLLPGCRPGPTVALRADMDALPITEKGEATYRSRESGKMHACGHDGHTALLLGVARMLSERRKEIPGMVKFIFQPAEEAPGGARPMIQAGILRDPEVDLIFGLHIWNSLPVGTFGLKDGAFFSAVDQFDIELEGRGAHGAEPHRGRDPLPAAGELIGALQTVVSRQISPFDSAVLTVGKIAGGYQRNVIAENVRMEGTVRTLRSGLNTEIEEKIRRLGSGISRAHDIVFNLSYQNKYPVLVNSEDPLRRVKETVTTLFGKEACVELDQPTMAGEDFACYLDEVPGCFFWLGGSNEEKGLTAPNHSPHFDFDEEALVRGMAVLAGLVLLNEE